VVLGEKSMAEIATTLPLSAIVRSVRDKNHFAVYVIDGTAPNPRVHQQEVELGPFRGNSITVSSGLQPDAQVVVQGAAMLSDGDVVRVVP
jgi:hypothetical protein